MSIFCFKKISPPVRLGEQLKEARTKLGLSLETVSSKTRIAEKYLQAIEESNFEALPKARAYRLAYIRGYAGLVKLNPQKISCQFCKENGLGDVINQHPRRSFKCFPFYSFSWMARNVLIALFLVVFIGYLSWQVRGILTPPVLDVYSPQEGFISGRAEATVQGKTEKECRLTINGQTVQVDERGNFTAPINLSTGVNTITLSATKKHGKTTTVTRHVVVKESVNSKPVSVNITF